MTTIENQDETFTDEERKRDLVDRDSAAFPPTQEGVWTVRGGVPRRRHTALIARGAWLHTGCKKS